MALRRLSGAAAGAGGLALALPAVAWAHTLEGARDGAAPGQPGQRAGLDGGAALNGQLLDLLIVTSIKRPNLATYVWTASRRAGR